MVKSFNLSIKLPLTMVGLVLLAIAVIVSVQSFTTQKMVGEEGMLKAEEMAFRYANDIDAYVEVALDSARTLAQVFETAANKSAGFEIGREQANAILQGVLKQNPDFLGVWTCWEPNAFDGKDTTFKGTQGHDDTGRFVPYWYREGGKIAITALVDYAKQGAGDYYLLARNSGAETIVEPYEYEVGGKKILITSVVVPIHDPAGNKIIGVVGIDIDLNNINKIASTVRPYETGWGTLLSNTGIIAANPKSDRIGKKFSDFGDPNLRRMALQKITTGESFREIEADKERNATIVKVFVPIWFGSTKTPWCFMINMHEDKVLAKANDLVISSVYLGLGVAFVATLAAIFFARRITGPIRRLVSYADAVSKGDLDAKNDIKRNDEIGVLAGVIQQMVKNLKEKSYWYENILNAIPFPVSVTDNDMNWTFLNKAVEDLAKVKASDMIGKHCSNWGANICNTEECGIRCAEKGHGQGRSYFTQPQFPGKEFLVDCSFIFNNNKEKIGHIEVIQDITEANELKRKAEDALKEGILQAAKQLESVVEVVTSASEELSAQIEQSSKGSEQQSNQISETATSMEEMNATVLEVAKNASNAAEISMRAKEKAQAGEHSVKEVVEKISDVQNTAVELKNDVISLGKQAEGIGNVLNVISDIADQTNLLALNAAIEAARAGDAGRGFAVVADEVRKLAEKTMTATKEVGQAIIDIQQGTKKNIQNVENAVLKIDSATAFAHESGKILKEIVVFVDQSSDQVRSIATASEQQSAASEEINRSIEQVSTISRETAEAMQQSAHAVGELANQSSILRGLIEEMKSGSAKSKKALL